MSTGFSTNDVLSAIWLGLEHILDPSAFLYMLLGIVISSTLVALPGIGSKTAIALLLPLAFSLEKFEAICLIVSIWAVSNTANSITSILFAIPGGSGSQATILDGYPMTKKGQASRALSASFAASALGGVSGAFVLAISIPWLHHLILFFGPPELFVLILFGITMVATISGENKIRGIIIGCLGLLFSTVGIDQATGTARYTYDTSSLMDGLGLIPVTIGLFAIPEIISLITATNTNNNANLLNHSAGIRQGIRDAVKNWWLIVRSSMIGVWIGIIPGLGSSVADWFAYGYAKNNEKGAKKSFGKGDVRGVIAVDAATNAKEGGSLIPTLAFGIPGSSTLALVFGALLVVGVKPGKEILSSNLDITFSFIWLLIISSLLTSILCMLFIKPLVKVTQVQTTLLVPGVFAFSVFGCLASANNTDDLFVMMVFGILGYLLKKNNWPVAPLILGLVLGAQAESYLWTSYQLYGWDFIFNPIAGTMFVILLLIPLWPTIRKWYER